MIAKEANKIMKDEAVENFDKKEGRLWKFGTIVMESGIKYLRGFPQEVEVVPHTSKNKSKKKVLLQCWSL